MGDKIKVSALHVRCMVIFFVNLLEKKDFICYCGIKKLNYLPLTHYNLYQKASNASCYNLARVMKCKLQ